MRSNRYNNDLNGIPRPNYDRDVNKIIAEYRKALRSIQAEMALTLSSDKIRRSMLTSFEKQLTNIIGELESEVLTLSSDLIHKTATDGVAQTMYGLGYAKTLNEAKKYVRFGTLNKPLIEAVISDTQTDLLAVTDNISRHTRRTMRNAIGTAMREQYASGGGRGRDVAKAVMDELAKESNIAIIDAAGRKWKTETYVKMAVQTNAMNAHREASINSGLEEGAYYGVISSHGAIDACANYEGKVVAMAPQYATDEIPYVEDLPRSSIFHPFCKHIVTSVFNPDRYM